MNDKPLYFYLNKKVNFRRKNLNNNITSENCKNCFVHFQKIIKEFLLNKGKIAFNFLLNLIVYSLHVIHIM